MSAFASLREPGYSRYATEWRNRWRKENPGQPLPVNYIGPAQGRHAAKQGRRRIAGYSGIRQGGADEARARHAAGRADADAKRAAHTAGAFAGLRTNYKNNELAADRQFWQKSSDEWSEMAKQSQGADRDRRQSLAQHEQRFADSYRPGGGLQTPGLDAYQAMQDDPNRKKPTSSRRR